MAMVTVWSVTAAAVHSYWTKVCDTTSIAVLKHMDKEPAGLLGQEDGDTGTCPAFKDRWVRCCILWQGATLFLPVCPFLLSWLVDALQAVSHVWCLCWQGWEEWPVPLHPTVVCGWRRRQGPGHGRAHAWAGEVQHRMLDSFQRYPDNISAWCFCFLCAVILCLALVCGTPSLHAEVCCEIVPLGCRGAAQLYRCCMLLTRKKPVGLHKIT